MEFKPGLPGMSLIGEGRHRALPRYARYAGTHRFYRWYTGFWAKTFHDLLDSVSIGTDVSVGAKFFRS